MHIHILGSAAGGGVPQWNCGCPNCRAARRSNPSSHARRTQSSVTISADGKRWILLNASPDLRTQFASFAPLAPPRGRLRGSPVQAVVLTDGELDHVTGLLSLREQKELRLACTPAIRALLTKKFPILPTLRKYCRIRHTSFPTQIGGLHFSSMDVCEKAPLYADHATKRGGVVGLRIEEVRRGTALAYLPCLTVISDKVRTFVRGCGCLLVDGTFWSNDEMTSLGLTKRSARDMGHVPITGSGGSLSWLRELDVPRKVYIHINNTNPILRRGSPERKAVERAGIEVGYDGMNIRM